MAWCIIDWWFRHIYTYDPSKPAGRTTAIFKGFFALRWAWDCGDVYKIRTRSPPIRPDHRSEFSSPIAEFDGKFADNLFCGLLRLSLLYVFTLPSIYVFSNSPVISLSSTSSLLASLARNAIIFSFSPCIPTFFNISPRTKPYLGQLVFENCHTVGVLRPNHWHRYSRYQRYMSLFPNQQHPIRGFLRDRRIPIPSRLEHSNWPPDLRRQSESHAMMTYFERAEVIRWKLHFQRYCMLFLRQVSTVFDAPALIPVNRREG